jgi:PadR family transcriptional regulator, regulatory protein PadR
VNTSRAPIPPGTLDMVILKTLSRGGSRGEEMHGFEIANAVYETSANVLQVEEGSLYPALHRLLLKGWISGKWGRTAGNRRARYYRLTISGRRQLTSEIEAYRRVSGAICLIIQTV